MAKRAPEETSTPLVVALVFFVLTTIAFGVMWYMSFSDQETMKAEADKAKKAEQAAKTQEGEAILKLRVNKSTTGSTRRATRGHRGGDERQGQGRRRGEAHPQCAGQAVQRPDPPRDGYLEGG